MEPLIEDYSPVLLGVSKWAWVAAFSLGTEVIPALLTMVYFLGLSYGIIWIKSVLSETSTFN